MKIVFELRGEREIGRIRFLMFKLERKLWNGLPAKNKYLN